MFDCFSCPQIYNIFKTHLSKKQVLRLYEKALFMYLYVLKGWFKQTIFKMALTKKLEKDIENTKSLLSE